MSEPRRQQRGQTTTRTFEIVRRDLCLDEVGEEGIDLDSRRFDAEELSSQCARPRSPEWVDQAPKPPTECRACLHHGLFDKFRGERFFETAPALKRQRGRTRVGTDRRDSTPPGPVRKPHPGPSQF